MNFKLWTKDGKERIYVNGAADSGISVYVVDGATTGHYSAGFPETVIRAKDGRMIGQSEIDRIGDSIDEFVKDARPSDVNPTYADYRSLAK